MAEFYDNTCMDLLESMVIQVKKSGVSLCLGPKAMLSWIVVKNRVNPSSWKVFIKLNSQFWWIFSILRIKLFITIQTTLVDCLLKRGRENSAWTYFQYTPVECFLSGQAKYRTVKTVLARNKILMSNEAPAKGEMEKAINDIARFEKLELNTVWRNLYFTLL